MSLSTEARLHTLQVRQLFWKPWILLRQAITRKPQACQAAWGSPGLMPEFGPHRLMPSDEDGDTMGFLAGKRLLITGLLSNRSIAYGIARACHREGAELAFSYQGERFKERITEFAAEFDSTLVFDCDVADDAQIARLFDDLSLIHI